MADDFYTRSAQRRYDELQAQKQQALANLAAAKAADDYDSAAEAIQFIANVDATAANLNALHSAYQASLNPPAPPPTSREERAAKPFDRMDYNDALDLARQSKYGRSLDHNDPYIRAGYAEVQRRRGRGE